jgi:hypothetical protein
MTGQSMGGFTHSDDRSKPVFDQSSMGVNTLIDDRSKPVINGGVYSQQ